MAMNVSPGPLLFEERPDVVWGLVAALFIGNLLLMVPPYILMPIVGIYSLSHSLFDLYLMIGFCVGAYFLRKLDVPLAPIILGLLLGTLMEENLRRALNISNGDWTVLVQSPLAIGIWTFALLSLLAPPLIGRFLCPRLIETPQPAKD